MDPPGISLARPPESISAVEMLEAVHGSLMLPRSTHDNVVQLLQRRDLLLRQELAGTNLKTLAEDSVEELHEPAAAIEVRRDH
jgi:DNA-binding IscR family transcriptional regulator